MTAMAKPAQNATAQAEPFSSGFSAPGAAPLGDAAPPVAQPVPDPPKHPAHYLWAVLIARIYAVFPLVCPICGGQMRIIAFITPPAYRDHRRTLRGPPALESQGGAVDHSVASPGKMGFVERLLPFFVCCMK